MVRVNLPHNSFKCPFVFIDFLTVKIFLRGKFSSRFSPLEFGAATPNQEFDTLLMNLVDAASIRGFRKVSGVRLNSELMRMAELIENVIMILVHENRSGGFVSNENFVRREKKKTQSWRTRHGETPSNVVR